MPIKETVLAASAVNVPVLMKVPETVKVLDTLMVKDALPPIVILRHEPLAELITGWCGAVDEMETSVVLVGIPLHQLLGSFQSVLVVPSQVPAVQPVLTLIMPVFAATNHVSFLFVANEPVLPHEPVVWLTPPRVKVVAVDVPPLANNPFAVPLIDKLLLMPVPLEIVLLPEPLSVRLL